MITNDFANVMAVLSAAYPSTMISGETVILYSEFLGAMPKERLNQAIHTCISRHRFLPTIADILEAANFIRREQQRGAQDHAQRVLLGAARNSSPPKLTKLLEGVRRRQRPGEEVSNA